MRDTRLRPFALAIALLLGGLAAPARASDDCTTPRCQSPTEIAAMQRAIAEQCDCAGAAKAGAYLQCVKRVVGGALRGRTLARTCKGAVLRCEAKIGCGRGIRPFRTVQQIFTQSCALPSCHSGVARQGGLVLDDEGVSYRSLVGRPATLEPAAALVVPGDPDASFLIQKLKGTAPGSQMPQGGRPLSKGTVKLIEQWIARGALSTEEECKPADTPGKQRGRKTCNDRPLRAGSFTWKPEPPLPPPAAENEVGVQLYTPPLDVPAGKEWEKCYAFKAVDWPGLAAQLGYAPGTLPVVKRQTYRMHEGSHHLLLYAYFGQYPERWADGYFDCFAGQCDASNPNDCPPDAGTFTIPIGGTQVAGTRYEVNYPDGVGVPVLNSKAVIIANLHYTNPFQPQQPIYGESWLNLYLYPSKPGLKVLDGIFAVNYADLFVEPYTSRTISRIWQPRDFISRAPTDASVFQLFGHMHKRGTLFQIDFVRDGKCSASGALCGRDEDCACGTNQPTCQAGQSCVRGPTHRDETIYYTTAWDQAPVVDYQKPYLKVAKEEGLRWTCTHVNGVAGDATRPPKKCHEGCVSCGWDPDTRTCVFTRGDQLGFQDAPRVYALGDPMPVVFGELADDDMCNMFGYFIKTSYLDAAGDVRP
jgi:hypothetical protein